MNYAMKQAKLLIGIVPRTSGEQYVGVTKAAGARGGTITYGRTYCGGKLTQLFSLGDVYQEVVFTLLGNEADAVITALCAAAQTNPKKHHALVMVLDVTGKIVRTQAPTTLTTPATSHDTEKKAMESGYTLITVIVNNGYADDVTVAARKAGATGCTILNARGTGTEEDVKFFGISLVPEKEMLLIVAENEKIAGIVKSVSDTPHLSEPGGGIVYTMNVEQFFVLGK